MADGGSITLRLAVAGAEAARAGVRELAATGAEAGRALEGSYSAATKAAVEAIARTAQLAAAQKAARDSGVVKTRGQASAFGAAFNAEWKAASKGAQDAGEAVEELSGKVQFNRAQWMELQHVGRSAFDSLAAGASPFRVLTMEGGRLAEVLGGGKGGLSGGVAAAKTALGSLGQLLTVGRIALGATAAAAVVAGKAYLDYSNGVGALDLTLRTAGDASGATTTQLEAIAEAAAKAGGVTVAQAREMEQALLRTGEVGTENYKALITVSGDYAKATGQDAAGATKDLALAMADPIKASEELDSKLHFLSQTQLDHIRNLVEQGDKSKATAELVSLLEARVRGAGAGFNFFAEMVHQAHLALDGFNAAVGGAIANSAGHQNTKSDDIRTQITQVQQRGLGGHSTPEQARQVLASLQADLVKAVAEEAKGAVAKAREEAKGAVKTARGVDPDYATLDGYRQQRDKLVDAQGRPKISGLSAEDAKQVTDAVAGLTHAINTYVPREKLAQERSAAQLQLAQAKTPAEKSAAQRKLSELDQAGKVESSDTANMLVSNSAAAAGARATGKGKSAETLANEAAAAARKTDADVERYKQETMVAAGQEAQARAAQAKSALESAAADPTIDAKTRKARMDAAQAALQQANSANDELALDLRRIADKTASEKEQIELDRKLSRAQKDRIEAAIAAAAVEQGKAAKAKDDARKAANDTSVVVASGQLQRQVLQAQAQDTTRSAGERIAASLKLAELERAELAARYDQLLSAEGVSEAHKVELRAALAAAEATKLSSQVSSQVADLHRSLLQSTAQQGLTAVQRNAAEAELLKISQDQRTLQIDTLAKQAEVNARWAQATGDEATAAKLRADVIKMRQEAAQLTKAELEALRRQQQSPLEKQQQAIKDKSADPRTQAENNIAGGLNGLSDELVQVTNGTKTFKQALANVAGSIGNSFLKDFYERTITAPLSQASSKLLDKVFGPKQTAEAQAAAATVDLTAKSTTLAGALDTLTSSVQQAASAMGNVGGSGTGGGTLVGGNGDIPGLTGPTGPSFSSFMSSGGGGNDFLATMMNFGKSIFDKGGNTLLNAAMGGSGGAGGVGSWLSMLLKFIPGFASGTDFAPGGPALVGENGPEYVNLPRGAQVYSNGRTPPPIIAATTRSSANDNRSGAPSVTVNNHTGVQAQAKVSTGADGVTTIDLYRHVMQPAMREAGRSGDLARALKTSPPIVKRRA